MAQIINPFVLSDAEPSGWLSCRAITANLEGAYRHAFRNQLPVRRLSRYTSPAKLHLLAEDILRHKPSHLIFVGHQELPPQILAALDRVYGKRAWPRLIFHLYGDFTFYSSIWRNCEPFLRGHNVCFVASSPRQEKLVQAFLPKTPALTARCPFPVSRTPFSFRAGARARARAKLGIRHDEKVVLYAGRLSLQKNITLLTESVMELMKAYPGKIRFLLAGNFDHTGAPFFGHSPPLGAYFAAWRALLQSQRSLAKNIQYLGPQDPGQLAALYQAADLYTSLSAHHDEDFGMAPLEALCCGCPALLTSWGGYAAYESPASCHLVPVSIGDSGLCIQREDFLREALALLTPSAPDDRERRSAHYLKRFSVESVAAELPQRLATMGGASRVSPRS